MNLSFITDEATQDPFEILSIAEKNNLDFVEIRTILGKHIAELSSSKLRDIDTMLRDAGLTLCCLDTPVFKCGLEECDEQQIEFLKKCADVAEFLGSPLLRIFTFWRQPVSPAIESRIYDWVTRALAVVEGRPLKVGIENGRRTMHCTGEEVASLIRCLDSDDVCAVWDPANSIFGETDLHPLEEGYRAVSPFIGLMHLKQPHIQKNGEFVYGPMPDGEIDIAKMFSLLKGQNYQGAISLETHWRHDREFSREELDLPGGEQFSAGGVSATNESLEYLNRLQSGALS